MKIKYTIVVEGSNDKAYLSSFIDGEIISVNGREVSAKEIDYLSQISNLEPVIIFTDSDKSGEDIRNILESKLKKVIHIRTDENHFTSKKKHGVKETEKKYLISLLKPYEGEILLRSKNKETLINEFSNSIDNYRNLKTLLVDTFHLGKCNSKNIVFRLNRLGITYNEIEGIL